ncbi:MAG TPA: outer membrane lipoprotein chaperone LolA [Methylophilaceae bacterium]|nr:outer membrane lipoprotein chaperone LolA [Methylophilaceae bacterium]HZV61309.1 outer membrane lipoprotein chaperone LolA [Methylophilaceae bacterium]
MTRFLISLIAIFPLVCHAGGVDQLHAFFNKAQSMRAHFHQTVVDSQGRKVQEVDGTMQLQRPGKFRWDYNKPYVQQIVGDGEKVWLFDPELNQVTVRTISSAIGSSPAALLAGSKEIEKSFELKDEGRQDALEWVMASPRDEDNGFEKVYLGFQDNVLKEMEMRDNFGHITVIEFSSIELNPKLSSQTFSFKPPAGADVVGE